MTVGGFGLPQAGRASPPAPPRCLVCVARPVLVELIRRVPAPFDRCEIEAAVLEVAIAGDEQLERARAAFAPWWRSWRERSDVAPFVLLDVEIDPAWLAMLLERFSGDEAAAWCMVSAWLHGRLERGEVMVTRPRRRPERPCGAS